MISPSSLGDSMPAHFRFLDLPLELRGMIYDLVLSDEKCTVLAQRGKFDSASLQDRHVGHSTRPPSICGPSAYSEDEQDTHEAIDAFESPRFKFISQSPSILAVSHQIRAEAIAYYHLCTFCIDVRPLRFHADGTPNVTVVFKRVVTEALPHFLGSTTVSRIRSINLIAGSFDTEHTAARECYMALDSVLSPQPPGPKDDGKTTTTLTFDAFLRPPTRSVSSKPRAPGVGHPESNEALDQSRGHFRSDYFDISDDASNCILGRVSFRRRDCSYWHYKSGNRVSGSRESVNRFMDI